MPSEIAELYDQVMADAHRRPVTISDITALIERAVDQVMQSNMPAGVGATRPSVNFEVCDDGRRVHFHVDVDVHNPPLSAVEQMGTACRVQSRSGS